MEFLSALLYMTVKWDGAPVLFTSETPSDYPLPVSLPSSLLDVLSDNSGFSSATFSHYLSFFVCIRDRSYIVLFLMR
jgi:hypothetical protein